MPGTAGYSHFFWTEGTGYSPYLHGAAGGGYSGYSGYYASSRVGNPANWSSGLGLGDWNPVTGSASYANAWANGAKYTAGGLYLGQQRLERNNGNYGYWQYYPTVTSYSLEDGVLVPSAAFTKQAQFISFKEDGSKSYWDDFNWVGALDATVGILGGLGEVGVGLAAEGPSAGVSTFLVIDGFFRIVTNGAKLGTILFKQNEIADALPSNLGGTVGWFMDGAMGGGFFEKGGKIKYTLGLVNDAATILIGGTSGHAIESALKNPTVWNWTLYGATYLGTISSAVNNSIGLGPVIIKKRKK